MGKVIAIDGPSGSGKGTISLIIANRLGITYLDTGALYRAIALKLRRSSLEEDASDEAIGDILSTTSLAYKNGQLLLDGAVIGDEIRTPEIGHFSSVFSARRIVRDFLLDIQRKAALDHDLIAEGRDMTTVVFPDAYRKFFLTASEEERARRRFEQLREKGMKITMEEAIRDIHERDERDSKRDIAPLKKTDDAILVDTTTLSIEKTAETIIGYL